MFKRAELISDIMPANTGDEHDVLLLLLMVINTINHQYDNAINKIKNRPINRNNIV